MSNQRDRDVVAVKEMYLLKLSGVVTVQYLDGETIEGEITAQDEANIFLAVDNEPVMIPRSQIRLLRGEVGQSIEPDSSAQAFGPPMLGSTPDPNITSELMNTTPRVTRDNDDLEGTMVFPMGGDEGTIVLDNSTSNYESNLIRQHGEAFASSDETANSVGNSHENSDEATMILSEGESEVTFVTQPQFICTGGPHSGQSFLLDDETTIGRASSNTIPLVHDKEISRRHAVVEKQGDSYFIQDQNSLNGTYVNDVAAVGPRQLHHGDIILVGVSHLQFHSG